MTSYLLAIDGGSQSTKISVIDAAGNVHAVAQEALRAYELGPGGRAVHPDDDLWDSLISTSRRLLAEWPGDPREIVAIGLCGIRFCRALLDADGRLTEPVLSWMDERVSQPLGTVSPEVALVTSAGGYLAARLTGERRDSAASFQGMWPMDQATRRWSTDPEVLAATGIAPHLLPELVDPGDLLGRVTEAAAESTGLPSGLPVYATANDKAVEALGSGLVDPATTLLSLGTYIASMTLGDRAVSDDPRYWTNAAAVPGRFLHESGGIRRGMWTVSWLRQLVSAAAPELVEPGAVQAWLEDGARDVPPGCGGLITVPDWLAPGHAPHRRGAIIGLDGSHGPHHLYRSVLEGIVLTMKVHTEAMEDALGRRASRILVSGGGSRSTLMSRIVADVYGRPVERAAVSDAAGLGSAMCAAVGVGLHADFEAAIAAMVRPGIVVEPSEQGQRQYADIAAVYADVAVLLDPVFRRMAAASGTC